MKLSGEMRIMVTGSREWTDGARIYNALDYFASLTDLPVILISGACPRGADYLAEMHAEWRGWKIHRYPAEWQRYGRSAGMIRNSEMIKYSEPNICLAFIKNNSPGATGAAKIAKRKGIRVEYYLED